MLIQRDLAAGGGRLAQQQGSARRRASTLALWWNSRNFDIEILVERLRDPLHQRRQQIDAEAHIA